jgi:hypothetical protein
LEREWICPGREVTPENMCGLEDLKKIGVEASLKGEKSLGIDNLGN